MRTHRRNYRVRRSLTPVPVVALVGYTNAGKSTLLNTLTQAGVLAEDKLFATLDPTTRRIRLKCVGSWGTLWVGLPAQASPSPLPAQASPSPLPVQASPSP